MKKILVILGMLSVLGCLLASAGHSTAGNYGYGYGHQQYGYGYHQQYNYVYETNPVVVIGVPVSNLGVSYYWSVGQELREERVAQKAAEILGKNQRQAPPRQQQVAPAPGPGVLLDFDLVSAAVTEAATTAPAQAGQYDEQVRSIFTQSCARCHKPGSDKPALKLLNADGSLYKSLDWKSEFKRRQSVYDACRATEGVSPMPKNAEQLPDEQIEIIYLWMRELTQ